MEMHYSGIEIVKKGFGNSVTRRAVIFDGPMMFLISPGEQPRPIDDYKVHLLSGDTYLEIETTQEYPFSDIQQKVEEWETRWEKEIAKPEPPRSLVSEVIEYFKSL